MKFTSPDSFSSTTKIRLGLFMNPYEELPQKAFWKLAVANKSMFDISELWDPKFHIKPKQKIVTFGSCFAQHIGQALKKQGYMWFSTERPPFGLSEEHCKKYNYNIFSARTGNIYTTTLLNQWTQWALGTKAPPYEVWEYEERYYDPFRPSIEPNGFASPEETRQSLNQAIKSFKESIQIAQYFVFTLGLTESWHNTEGNYEYPICPGTVAGDFDAEKHKFVNQQYDQIIQALEQSVEMMRSINPSLNFILTVSPVPLTATNTHQHIAVATMASKSTLRAVTNQLATNRAYVDYFPSYEIINSPIFKGAFFEPNQRNVSLYGVNFVMSNFFRCLADKFEKKSAPEKAQIALREKADEVCEEEILEAFSKK